MIRDEVIKLLECLIGAYPETFIKDVESTVNIWCLNFAEEECETVFKAARIYMRKGTKFPTPADIRKCMSKVFLYDTPINSTLPVIDAEESTDDKVIEDTHNALVAVSESVTESEHTGCEICPYADTDWVDSPNGCHRKNCIV